MKVNILTGSKELGEALMRYLVYLVGTEPHHVRLIFFGEGSGLSREILDADFWIAEAWNPLDPGNPEGFRTLVTLSGRAKCLILFLFTPRGFPSDGSFWCRLPCSDINGRIKRAMESDPPTWQDYQKLVDLWPDLAYDPRKHRHHGTG